MTIYSHLCSACGGDGRFDVSEPNPVGDFKRRPEWQSCTRCGGLGRFPSNRTEPKPDLMTWFADCLRLAIEDDAIRACIVGDAS
jgi:hypothetical protein